VLCREQRTACAGSIDRSSPSAGTRTFRHESQVASSLALVPLRRHSVLPHPSVFPRIGSLRNRRAEGRLPIRGDGHGESRACGCVWASCTRPPYEGSYGPYRREPSNALARRGVVRRRGAIWADFAPSFSAHAVSPTCAKRLRDQPHPLLDPPI